MRIFYTPDNILELNLIFSNAKEKGNYLYFSTTSEDTYVIRIDENKQIYYSYVGTANEKKISWTRFQQLKNEIWEDVKE